MKKQSIISIVACVIAVLAIIIAFVPKKPDKNEIDPASIVAISDDGYWVINGVKTEHSAVGKDGIDGINGINGIDGINPTIAISEDGFWVINGVKTEYVAIGKDGADGKDGEDGVDGTNGTNGQDGITPTIAISDDGYWIINGTKTEYVAIGKDGADGADGEDGEDGTDGITPTIAISDDGYWVINGVKTDVKAKAGDFTEENPQGLKFYRTDDNTYIVSSGDAKYLSNIVIPETYLNCPVVAIEASAFYGSSTLKSITIPDSITSIGEYAFAGCKSLESIILPESLISIGDYAFQGCSLFTNIVVPDSVQTIGYSAFNGCSSLTSMTLPFVGGSANETEASDITMFGYIFGSTYYNGASKVDKFDIETQDIDYSSCYYIPSSLEHVTITGGKIYNGAFCCCNMLTTIDIPDTITSIEPFTFAGCEKLKDFSIPDSVTKIGMGAFYMCYSIESITIPDAITSIEMGVFCECVGLKSIVIPNNVTSIGDFAFDWCVSLESITIPNGVTTIGVDAFSNCDSLESITLPDSVTSIGDYAFAYNSSLESITLSKNITTIGARTFDKCTALESITIPKSVTTIGANVFRDCSSLVDVTYEGTIEEWYNIQTYDKVFDPVTCSDGIAALAEITLWVSTTEGVREFTLQQIEAFKAAHPEYRFNITIETMGEGDAATEVLKDVATAPDMYCFSQDQISRLVQAGALAPLSSSAAALVSANNDAGSVGAATVGENIYAYPLTSDNGYYLYYNSRYVSDEQAKTLEGIIEACKSSGRNFGYNLTNGWFTAGFFFAQPVGGGTPLCTSNWTWSDNGKNAIAVNDTFNSANGLIAMKAMNKLATSGVWVDSADNFSGTAAIVTGTWNANTAEAEYGDYMKATKLPTYTVDGQTFQMGSFSGYKLIGCKPQTDSYKAEVCSALALYLTSAEAQLERYYEFLWGPSNLEAQANIDVKDNILLSALIQQNVYSQPQGVIPSDWWSEAAVLGTVAYQANMTDNDFIIALEIYEQKINAMLTK